MRQAGVAPTIGVLINDVESTYQKHLCAELCKQAGRLGIRLVFYSGSIIGTPTWFERQMNLVYHLAHAQHLGGLLLVTSTFMRVGSEPIVHKLLEHFKGLPCVSLTAEIPGVPCVLLDNTTGLRQMLEHLIQDHGYRDFAFLSGPSGSHDAAQRLKTFRAVMAESGIHVDPRLIQSGEFYYFGARQAAEQMLASGLPVRVVVAANDEMALAAIAVVTERGLRVPEDIAVVGMDDLHPHVTEMGLSSVNQSTEEQVARSLALLQAQGMDEDPPHETVPSHFVRRRSCGCGCNIEQNRGVPGEGDFSARSQQLLDSLCLSDQEKVRFLTYLQGCMAALAAEQPHALEDALWPMAMECLAHNTDIVALQTLLLGIQTLMLDPQTCSAEQLWEYGIRLNKAQMVLLKAKAMHTVAQGERLGLASGSVNHVKRQLLSFEIHQQMEALPDVLGQFGIKTCMIAFYEEQGYFNTSNDYLLPKRARLVACVFEGKTYSEHLWRSFDTQTLLPEAVWEMTGAHPLTVVPAFQQVGHYGYIVFGPELPVGVSLEAVREAIASALIGALLVEEVGRVRDYLSKESWRRTRTRSSIEQMGQYDLQSGLLNLSGFLHAAHARLVAQTASKHMMVYVDVKNIEPEQIQLGQKEADVAFEGAARVFMNALRASDILGRIEPHRFVALCSDTDANFSSELHNRLAQAFAHLNQMTDKSYQVGCQLSFRNVESRESAMIESVLNQAGAISVVV
ncbi:substrate-binding domain-containing protein [Uliginosibacterium gangwonense]|uniref:substrate-binding domain-containing protein n=1 Tax=Uliginosibacterium gangwonense TaxID=392736 RepID=UPI000368506F|nr:substrate-binding domain-containing protein [Uliginosibacterium gangwonense]